MFRTGALAAIALCLHWSALMAQTAAKLAQPPAPAAAAAAEEARLTAFLDSEFAAELAFRPQFATRLGLKQGADRFDDISDEAALQALQWRRASVAGMQARFDRASLPAQAQVHYELWVQELERAELAYVYRRYQPPFHSYRYSVHSQLPDFLVNTHAVNDAEDLRNYAARVRALPAVLDTAMALSREAAAAGIRTPKFQIERVLAGSRLIVHGAPFDAGADSPLWADAKAKAAQLVASGKVAPSEANALLEQVREALMDLKPAYDRVIAWAQSALPTAPTEAMGAASLPDGLACYAAALKLNTTTDLSAQEVHATGLREVARIEAEQDALARQAGLADRQAYYAVRERRFAPVAWTDSLRDEYLRQANAFVGQVRKRLPAAFHSLPAYAMEVVREPAFSEMAGGPAHASPPSPDGMRPGRVYVHLAGKTEDPAAMYTLMCHEAVPGHVMHGDIQVRQTGLPMFRKTAGYVAFVEGWGLYAEALCKELGAFPDIAADFMRLDAELFRAARLVVDTGLHAQGWSEAQAVAYMHDSGRQPLDKARSEVRRYLTLPGQATGYKIGMLKIMELRRKAERELGDQFDLNAFHELLLPSGAQPLSLLERRVDDWIAARKGS